MSTLRQATVENDILRVIYQPKKRIKRAKGMRSPSEISYEREANRGKVDKRGQDENTTPPGKLSVKKQDGLSKRFNEDKTSRK